MKVLITGASGFLGSHIAEQLAGQGHSVRLLLRRTSPRRLLSALAYEETAGDITDAATLPVAVQAISAVIHAAGLTKPCTQSELDAVKTLSTANIVRTSAPSPSVMRFRYGSG